MRIVITIECDNAAFHGEPYTAVYEVARILKRASDRLIADECIRECRLLDINGNSVGTFQVEADVVELADGTFTLDYEHEDGGG